MSSNLSTLLEAARFLELQEQQRANNMEPTATTTTAAATTTTVAIKPTTITPIVQQTPQTITITQSKPVTANPNCASQTVVINGSTLAPITLTTPLIKKEMTTTSSVQQHPRQRILHNSFDIINPLIIDETSGETKRKQPPLAFRAGTREVHNKLEKHRRAHLKECFDMLKKHLPSQQDEKKTSNLSILHSALRYIQTLKRKERELEHEMERLAREKIAAQQRLAVLKKDISAHYDNVDFSKLLPDVVPATPTSSSTQDTPELIDSIKIEPGTTNSPSVTQQQNGISSNEKVAIPILAKAQVPVTQTTVTPIKEVAQPVQTAALSVLPMSYPVNQGLVLQKVALVPTKGLTELAPLVSTHFLTPQQINGKVVPLAQYLVKPVVVVSTASPRPS